MNRKEIYAKIKELNLSQEIKEHFGDNYTRISSSLLEEYVAKKTAKPKKTKECKCDCKKDNPWFYLGSILVSKKVITKQELDTLMGML